ncbi:amino acid adenylation domain-containing protein [Crossiella cryophila]|uniref:Amino acid adenylation domain-containing protein n=1 Tax=Crossiella cryophila TaxID=43355 RepID=A0A7W7FTW5_9PSEU|nr:amino acid adenylation domain-containing protein [Crossiella cryophila]MBB4678606.1 amino acid adenylation domain-containing protein [Crossiella cryophila]
MRLEQLLRAQARRTPDALALNAPDGPLTYRELDDLADRLVGALAGLGVRGGDRVLLWLDKSAFAVAAMQAVLRLGAAYVPVDPLSPARRVSALITDCTPTAMITTRERQAELIAANPELTAMPVLSPGKLPPRSGTDQSVGTPAELAYVLYTSGSTGKPKGVCVTHRAALAFVDWAVGLLGVHGGDRLANHAPFQFDLSVFDLYAAFHTGASVHLIPEGTPARALVRFVREHRITVWYSVPSALTLMMEHGRLLEIADLPLRAVLFAGEVFPLPGLKALRARWPELPLYNFYGPTETNVCTYHPVGWLSAEHTTPIPIGTAACGNQVWALRPDGSLAGPGEVGELMVDGPTLMAGYLGETVGRQGPYATGDLVRPRADGGFDYLGRRDHQVKVRGHRVELGEIEAVLTTHPDLVEAVVLVTGSGHAARLRACVRTRQGRTPSAIEIKRFLAERLPRHLVIDTLRQFQELPRTATGKVDRQRLLADTQGETHR